MRSATQLKSLGDIRTTISTHSRSTPRQKGSTYLEAYLLDKEKQRLETELEMLSKRMGRIETRLAEIQKDVAKLLEEGQTTPSVALSSGENQAAPVSNFGSRKWTQLVIEY